MQVSVTLLYGSLCTLLVAALGMNVSRVRVAQKVFVGGTPDANLTRFIRAHGNAAEWAPLQILMLLMLELTGAGSMALHVAGGAILFSRLLHAGGIYLKSGVTAAAAAITYVATVTMAIGGLVLHFR